MLFGTISELSGNSIKSIAEDLYDFWGAYGCNKVDSYDVPMGAATYHPATVFGAHHPEDLSICYLQPCRRPQDGRYGDSNNRLYQHHQFQVILQPIPYNIQELMYESLKRLGIDSSYDVRLIDNNWESPMLGACGVGWEVWCAGQEILQYTYFQKLGAKALEVPLVELAYGLERLGVALNHPKGVMEIDWDSNMSYREYRLQPERDHSAHALLYADKDMYRARVRQRCTECDTLLAEQLPHAAYDAFLHAVHDFNILHARGALGTAERVGIILELRGIAEKCCLQAKEQVTGVCENPAWYAKFSVKPKSPH